MAQTGITEDDLRALEAALPQMDEAAQRRALEIVRAELGPYVRGFRSNRIIDLVRPPFVQDHATGRLIPGVSEKQKLFLSLDVLEAFYGGAVGGAKSDSLLISALQYCDVPGYSALLLRETRKNMAQAGGILERAKEWLAPFRVTGECKWSGEDDSFFFQTSGRPARLTFSYLATAADRFNFKSAEFQYVGFEEVTEQLEECYLYLFSRLRRTVGMQEIPLRMRSASNPGGRHVEWVKERFVPPEYLRADPKERFSHVWTKTMECSECGGIGTYLGDPCVYCEGKKTVKRYFVPARLQDNPFIDQPAYRRSLVHLPQGTRQQYEAGDWDAVIEGNFFKKSWVVRYTTQGEYYRLRDTSIITDIDPITGKLATQRVTHNRVFSLRECTRFMTGDTASKLNTWNDYTVFCVWDLCMSSWDLMLLYCWRARIEVPRQMDKLKEIYAAHKCQFAMIEDKSSGIGIIQEAHTIRGEGVTINGYNPGDKDKLSRATVAQARWKAGQIWVPADAPPWLDAFLREVLEFDGDDEKHDDCVDNLSMAAHYAANHNNLRRQTANSPPQELMAGRGFSFGIQ